eukprot:UC1_evm1s776
MDKKLRAEAEAERDTLRAEVAALKSKTVEAGAALQASEKKLALATGSMQGRLQQAEEAREAAVKEAKKFRGELDITKSQVEVQQIQLEGYKAEAQEKARRAETAEAAKGKAEEAMSATVGALDADLRNKDERISSLQQALRDEREGGASRIINLEKELKTARSEHSKALADVKGAAEKDRNSLFGKIHGLEAKLEMEASRLEEARAEMRVRETLIESLQTERDHLKMVMRQQMTAGEAEKAERAADGAGGSESAEEMRTKP